MRGVITGRDVMGNVDHLPGVRRSLSRALPLGVGERKRTTFLDVVSQH